MAEYVKKILVFNEIQKGFATKDKTVGGVLKIEKTKGNCLAEVYVTNFLRRRAKQIECVLCVAKSIYKVKVESTQFEIKIDDVSQNDDILCLLAVINGQSCIPFAFATNGQNKTADDLTKFLSLKVQDSTMYEDFVCATDNYFEEEVKPFDIQQIRKKSQQKFEPIKDLAGIKADKDKNFFDQVQPILQNIFETYPPCEELNDQFKNSFWVKVPFKNEKFFVVGLLENKDKTKYIVYGVPGKKDKNPNDSSFKFVPMTNNYVGYWMLFQDVKTGQCVKDVDFD